VQLSTEFSARPLTKNPICAIELKIINFFSRFWYKENSVPMAQENTPKNSKIFTKLSAMLFKQKSHRAKKNINPILGTIEKTIVELKGAPS